MSCEGCRCGAIGAIEWGISLAINEELDFSRFRNNQLDMCHSRNVNISANIAATGFGTAGPTACSNVSGNTGWVSQGTLRYRVIASAGTSSMQRCCCGSSQTCRLAIAITVTLAADATAMPCGSPTLEFLAGGQLDGEIFFDPFSCGSVNVPVSGGFGTNTPPPKAAFAWNELCIVDGAPVIYPNVYNCAGVVAVRKTVSTTATVTF